jgi:hypothetical protein
MSHPTVVWRRATGRFCRARPSNSCHVHLMTIRCLDLSAIFRVDNRSSQFVLRRYPFGICVFRLIRVKGVMPGIQA